MVEPNSCNGWNDNHHNYDKADDESTCFAVRSVKLISMTYLSRIFDPTELFTHQNNRDTIIPSMVRYVTFLLTLDTTPVWLDYGNSIPIKAL